MEISKIQSEIVAHLEKEGKRFETDTNLFEADIIDSMGVLELIAFIEDDLGIEMNQDDLTIENFNTVEAIVQTVERYKG